MAARLTVERWQLGLLLQRLREQAKISQLHAGRHIGHDDSRISRVEQGSMTLTPDKIAQLLDLYGVEGHERQTALALGAATRRRAKRQKDVSSLPNSFQRFADLEANAKDIYEYEINVIPGLLQVPDYVRAQVTTAGSAWWKPDERDVANEERAAFRLQYQQDTWDLAKPKRFHFIIGEAALVSVVGDDEVMKQQLKHLLAVAYGERATIQVLPLSVSNNPASNGITVLDFGELVPRVGIASDGYGSLSFYTEEADTSAMIRVFRILEGLALTPEGSKQFITQKLAGM
jgi:transcriptional regulator with XRE-family HTH domain